MSVGAAWLVGASVVLTAAAAAAVVHPTRVPGLRIDEIAHRATSPEARTRVATHLRRRSSIVTAAALGEWADEIARSLRHGSTLRAALLAVLPADHILRERSEPVRHRLDRGAGVADACDRWADEINAAEFRGDSPLAAFAAVVGAAAHLGGSVSRPLERFAVVMRQRVSDERERTAQSAQARLSARVLTMVPIAVLVLLLVTDADVRRVVTEPTGATVVAVGLALNALGGWWMRRIVETSARGGR